MQNVKFPNSSLTIILSPGQYNQILYPPNTTYILFECGHLVVFILKHLTAYNLVNTTQNVNYVYSDMFRLA
jgi:hypothetical protein